MFLAPFYLEEVSDALAMRNEPVGDVGAVAIRGIGFGAHDAGTAFNLAERASGRLELLRLHVVGIGGAHASERLSFPAVGDAGFLEGSPQGFFVELRMTARGRICTHVDERADAGFLEDRYELFGAAGPMADRVDQAAALASFFSGFSALSVFLEAFLSPFCSSPPVAGTVASARSIRVTRASGALSPLRKPVFRMRR